MKKLLTILVFGTFMYSGSIFGQFVTIPDPNFVDYLNNNGYSAALSGNQLDTTNSLVLNATIIDCSNKGIADLEGIQYFTSLQTLDCSSNPISILPPFTSQLNTLNISNCNFTIIQSIPLTVTSLICRDNQATIFPSIPPGMIVLDCGGNLMTSLPTLPSSLGELTADSMPITQLPSLPGTLQKLVIGYNQLTSLPTLPNGLQEMSCNSNQLTALPTLPTTLTQLDCRDNLITVLPTLPASLAFLACGANLFTSFPALPTGLALLHCPNSLVTTLPTLPSSLITLDVGNSPLTSLPPLPASLNSLDVSNCQLTSIPELPAIMTKLWVANNPSLTCLPLLTQIDNLAFYSTSVNCLPNYGNVANSNPLLFSLPLCDIFNSNGCASYYNIAGQLFFDANSNCFKESSENSVNNIKINVFQGGNLVQQIYTSQDGFYSIDATLGTYDYSVDTIGKPFLVSCPPTGQLTSILTAVDSIDTGMNFGLECKPGFDVGVFSVAHSSSFFPGDTTEVFIKAGDMALIYSMNCANSIAGTLHIDYSGSVTYLGPAPGSLVPVSGGNSLDYTITDFGTLNPDSAFRFYLVIDTSAQSGQPVCLNISVTPLAGDQDTTNNYRSHCFIVVNSIDPNNKEVSPAGDITANQDWLYYTINFQNTGTAPAQHIIVTDTLESNLQESSFSFLGATHNVFVQVDGNIARFIFPNINLPDSASSQQGSHGHLLFKIKPDTGLTVGTIINNTASIYFDFNPPVITNTTINTIVDPSAITETIASQFALYPNPANSEIYVNYSKTNCNYSIIEQTGRIVFEGKLDQGTTRIVTDRLPAGIYTIRINSEPNPLYKKFAVSK